MRVKLEDDLRDAIINGACDTDVSVTAFVNALLRSGLRQHQTAHHPAEAGASLLKEALFASKFTVVEGDAETEAYAPGMLGILAAVLKNPVKTETPCPCSGKHYVRAYGIQLTCGAPKCREWVRRALINQAEAVSCGI